MADDPQAHELKHDEDVSVLLAPGSSEGSYHVTVRKAGSAIEKHADVPSSELFNRLHASDHVDAVQVDLPTSELTPLEPAAEAEPPPQPEPTPAPPAAEPVPAPAPPPDNPLVAWLKRLWKRLTGG